MATQDIISSYVPLNDIGPWSKKLFVGKNVKEVMLVLSKIANQNLCNSFNLFFFGCIFAIINILKLPLIQAIVFFRHELVSKVFPSLLFLQHLKYWHCKKNISLSKQFNRTFNFFILIDLYPALFSKGSEWQTI